MDIDIIADTNEIHYITKATENCIIKKTIVDPRREDERDALHHRGGQELHQAGDRHFHGHQRDLPHHGLRRDLLPPGHQRDLQHPGPQRVLHGCGERDELHRYGDEPRGSGDQHRGEHRGGHGGPQDPPKSGLDENDLRVYRARRANDLGYSTIQINRFGYALHVASCSSIAKDAKVVTTMSINQRICHHSSSSTAELLKSICCERSLHANLAD